MDNDALAAVDPQQHEALLKLLNAAPVGLVQTDAVGNVTLINGCAAMLLLPLATPPLRRLDNLFEVLREVAPGLAQQVAGFGPAHGTVVDGLQLAVPAGRRDGGLRHLALKLQKQGAQQLLAVLTDISQQVRDQQALRDSQAQLRFTLDAVQVGDWALDMDSGLMQRSRQFDRCLGHLHAPADDPRFEALLAQVHADDRPELLARLRQAVATHQAWQVECRVWWPDGSLHWIALHGQPQPVGAGHDAQAPLRLLGIVSDTTARRRAAAAEEDARRLQAENAQVQAASRMKSQFLATMSHELRTPLNAIIGFAELLHAGKAGTDAVQQHRFLGHIASSGRHLLQLINDVLDLSKVESGKFEFHPEPLNLGALLHDMAGVLHSAVQRHRIVLDVSVDEALGPVCLDAGRLKQLLFNLMSNAIKFSPEGGLVTVQVAPQGADHLRIEVADQGIGIAAEDLPRLFVEFVQLDAGHNRQREGTGLGLALTRRLVQAQGGTVGVRSVPGQGSVFHVVLNRQHGFDAQQAMDAAKVPANDTAQRLLVIEPDALAQVRLVHGLASQGFVVDVAANAERALHQAHRTAYDAITLDLQLSEQAGLGVLAGIRMQGASQASPVVGMSMPGDSGHAVRFAIADMLCKPLRSDEVVAAMSRYAGRQPQRARVLVVDDDALALDLMRATLASLGIEVLCLADPQQALQRLDELRPDALILDLMMPGMDGFEVMDALRRQPAWQALPVYVWTSMALSDGDYQRLASSARAILGKGGGTLAAMLDDLTRWRAQLSGAPTAPPG